MGRRSGVPGLVGGGIITDRDQQAQAVQEGRTLTRRGEHDAALRKLATVIAVAPRNPHAINEVGNVYLAQRKFEDALAAFDAALAEEQGLAPIHYNRAVALHNLGRPSEAMLAYRRAIDIDSKFALAHSGLGAALTELGEFDEAQQAYEAALLGAPNDARTLHRTIDLRKVGTNDPHVRTVDRLLARIGDLPIEDQIELYFAKAKSEADLGNDDAAFDFYLLGNAKKRSQITYNEAREQKFFADTEAVFSANFISERLGWGNSSPAPIFIVGMPRSGTTLVEQILASHPEVAPGGERTAVHGVICDVSLSLRHEYPGWVKAMSAADFANLAQRYLDRIGPLAKQNSRFTDKMPGNVLYVGIIALMFSNVRIISVRRNALDTCVSIFTNLFGDNLPFAYDLAEIGRFHRMSERLSMHWKTVLPTRTYLEVQYEDVVGDLETQARRLLEHVNLPWNPAVLEFYQTKRPVRTASVSQVRQPIYRTSIGSARRKYGDKLKPLIDALEGSTD